MSQVKINFNGLDSIRGIAALYVCIAHCRGVLWIGGAHYAKLHPMEGWGMSDFAVIGLNMLTRLSGEFVVLFFVLSGFSIAHSIQNTKQIKLFYWKRFLRLYPPYIGAIVWAGIVILIIFSSNPEYLDGTYSTPSFERLYNSRDFFKPLTIFYDLIYYPVLGGILNPFWSLIFEVIFYAIAPFVLRKTLLYIILSLLFFVIGFFIPHKNYILMEFIFEYNIYFVFGIVLYTYRQMIFGFFQSWRSDLILLVQVGLFLLMILVGLFFPGMGSSTSIMAVVFAYLWVIYFCVYSIRVNWLEWIGSFSYTLYITHFATIFLYLWAIFRWSGIRPPYIYQNLVFIPAIILCIGVAYIQYLIIEKKTKVLLDRFR